MEVIEQNHTIIDDLDGEKIIKKIELCGRNCYNSFDKIKEGSAEKLIHGLIKSGHESVLEHQSITVRLVTDRAVLAEITRHRMASFSVRSQRYCKYDDGVAFVRPSTIKLGSKDYGDWYAACLQTEIAYKNARKNGLRPEQARAVLPNSTATVIYMTCNLREWRLIFRLRLDKAAHPDIRKLLLPVYEEMAKALPSVFMDLWEMAHGEK